MVAYPDIQRAPGMRSWTVSAPDTREASVIAENWITALGRALEALDIVPCSGRLAAEVLPNGVVIANDLSAGRRFVVKAV